MPFPASLHTWPQNLDLAQIEAIVQEIEQEKEAGKTKLASDALNPANYDGHCRGGEEALEVGGHCCGPSRYGKSRRGCARFMKAIMIVVSCNYTVWPHLDDMMLHRMVVAGGAIVPIWETSCTN